MRTELEEVASTTGEEDISRAADSALRGDYRIVDQLVPSEGLVETRPSRDGLELEYRTSEHQPYRCFTLVLSTEGNEVYERAKCAPGFGGPPK